MSHDLAHEYAQNAAIRILAAYVRDLRSAVKDRYPIKEGNPVDDVDGLLKALEVGEPSPLESVLNRPVPLPEEVEKIFPRAKALPKKAPDA